MWYIYLSIGFVAGFLTLALGITAFSYTMMHNAALQKRMMVKLVRGITKGGMKEWDSDTGDSSGMERLTQSMKTNDSK